MSTDSERPGRRSASRSWGARLAALALASLALVVATRSAATSLTDIALIDGTAWVSSSVSGDAVLANSTSREVSARIPIDGTLPLIEQAGADALLFDPNSGSLRILRGYLLDVVDVPLPPVSEQSFLVSDWGHHRLVDPVSGTVFEIDTGTRSAFEIATFGPIDSLAAVDALGALWLTRSSTGSVLSIDERRRTGFAPTVAEPGTALGLARGRIVHVVIGGTPGTARSLNRAELGPSAELCATATDPEVPDAAFVIGEHIVTASRSEIMVSDSACTTHQHSTASGVTGRTVAAATDHLFAIVSDDEPSILIVDPSTGLLTQSPPLSPGTRLEIFEKDGTFWVNEVDGIFAGTVDAAGEITELEKVVQVSRAGSAAGDGDTVGSGNDDGPPISPDDETDDRLESESRPTLAVRNSDAVNAVRGLTTTSQPTSSTTVAETSTTSDDTTIETSEEAPPETLARTDSDDTAQGGGTAQNATDDAAATPAPATTTPPVPTTTTSSTTTPAPTVSLPESTTANVLGAGAAPATTASSSTTTRPAATTPAPTAAPATTDVLSPDVTPAAERPSTSVKPPTTVGQPTSTDPTNASTAPQSPPIDSSEARPNRAPASATATGSTIPARPLPADLAPTAQIKVLENRLWAFVDEPLTFIDVSTGAPTSRVWDFDDGQRSGSAPQITHRWTTPGPKRVRLNVDNDVSSSSETIIIVIEPETARFTPAFSWSPDKVPPVFEVGDTMSFADETTGHPEAWEWDWGDGNADTGRNAVHIWESPGQFRVSLTVSGRATHSGEPTGDLITGSVYTIVTIVDATERPAASFDLTSTEVKAGDQIIVGDTSSGQPTSWVWDFGDGTRKIGRSAVHRYEEPNEKYTITLTVSNSHGSGTTQRNVRVIPAGDRPVVRIDASTLTADVGEPVSFASSSSSDQDTHTWDWGDDETGTGRQTSHTWDAAGNYEVVLRVENDAGVAQESIDIVIDPIPEELEMLVNGKPVTGPVEAVVGQGFRFETRGGRDPGNWRWALGDGRQDGGRSLTHDYDNPGQYEVVTTFTDDGEPQTLRVTMNVVAPPTTTTSATAEATTTTDRAPASDGSASTPPADSSTTVISGGGAQVAAAPTTRPEIVFDPIIPVVGRPVTFRDEANSGPVRTTWTFPHSTEVSEVDGSAVTTTFDQAGVVTVTANVCRPGRSDLCTNRTIDVLVAAP